MRKFWKKGQAKSGDITGQAIIGDTSNQVIPITRCMCGHKFDGWGHVISQYSQTSADCPFCHRRLYYRASYEVLEAG